MVGVVCPESLRMRVFRRLQLFHETGLGKNHLGLFDENRGIRDQWVSHSFPTYYQEDQLGVHSYLWGLMCAYLVVGCASQRRGISQEWGTSSFHLV